jgi:hypothetical protein
MALVGTSNAYLPVDTLLYLHQLVLVAWAVAASKEMLLLMFIGASFERAGFLSGRGLVLEELPERFE